MAKKNWYDKGLTEFMLEISAETGLNVEQVQSMYSYLNNVGFIDYDMEKEFIGERFGYED